MTDLDEKTIKLVGEAWYKPRDNPLVDLYDVGLDDGCASVPDDKEIVVIMRRAAHYASELKVISSDQSERPIDTLLKCSSEIKTRNDVWWYDGYVHCNMKDKATAYVVGRGVVLVHNSGHMNICEIHCDEKGCFINDCPISEMKPSVIFWLCVVVYTLGNGDPIVASLNTVTMRVDPASSTELSVDQIDADVKNITDKVGELLQDPKNADRMKNVEIAFLTATTLATDTFWKKLLSGSLLLLDLAVDDSLLHKIWTVVSNQIFEGSNLSTVSEMFKSLRSSTTSRSVKQFLASILTPIVGNKKMSIGEIELLSLNAADKVQGVDLAACTIETVDYMIQAASYFAEHKSLIGFLVPLPELRTFMEEYWRVIDLYDKIKNGQDETDLAVVHEQLSDLLTRANDLRRIITDAHGSRQVTQCAGYLAARVRECFALMVEGDFKKMPFSMYVYGPTRCGKTTVTKILEKHLSDALGIPIAPGSKATISGAAKFMTELRPTTKWVVIDDVASVKPEFVNDPPAETFLRLVNNVVTALNQASVERKGEPAPRPHAVICTSNVYDMGSVATQCDPRPILARLHMHVEMNVKEEWKNSQGLWDAKRFYMDYVNGVIGDCWDFTIRQMVPDDSPVYSKRSLRDPPMEIGGVNFAMVVVEDGEYGRLEDVGIDTFLAVVRRECVNNKKTQEIAEKLTKSTVFQDHFCDNCKCRYDACVCQTTMKDPPEIRISNVSGDSDDPDGEVIESRYVDTIDEDLLVEPLQRVSVDPAHEVVSNALGRAVSRLAERTEKKTVKLLAEDLGTVNFHLSNLMGLNVDPNILANKLLILVDGVLRVVAKSRVFHYATWIEADIDDTLLRSAVETTHTREINEHVYSSVLMNFMRRIGISATALCSPLCAYGCVVAEPQHDQLVQWIRSKYGEWKTVRSKSVDSNTELSEVDLFDHAAFMNFGTDVDKALALASCTSMSLVGGCFGQQIVGISMSFLSFCICHIVSCLSPVGVLLSVGTLGYALHMLRVELKVEREYIITSIMVQIRTARNTYRRFREASPIVSTGLSMGLSAACVWGRWSRTVMCEPASSITRDPFFYEKWVKNHVTPLVHQPSTELTNTISNNVVTLSYDTEKETMRTRATAVQTSRLLVCQHFLPTKPTTIRLIRSPSVVDGVEVKNAAIHIDYEPSVNETNVGTTEIVLLRLKERVQFSDIVNRFSTTTLPHSQVGSIITRTSAGVSKVVSISKIEHVNVKPKALNRFTGDEYPGVPGLQFVGDTNYGDCGSSVIIGDKKATIHSIFMGKINENTKLGFSQCITKRMVEHACMKFNNLYMPDLTLPSFTQLVKGDQTITNKSNLAHLPEGNSLHFDYFGRVGSFCPERDKIIRTPLSETLEAAGYPCKWTTPTPGANPDIKSYDASMKYIKTVLEDTRSPPTEIVQAARRDYFKPYIEKFKDCDGQIRPLTWDECANGVPNSLYIHGIDTSTAMGFPYGGKKKDYMNQDDGGKWWFNDLLIKDIKRGDGNLRKLIIPEHAATVTNKMEPRPKGKVARKIVSVNCVMTVLFKKYFGPVFETILQDRNSSESAVGVNPYSSDWEQLWNFMKPAIGENMAAFDFSSFDMRIGSFLLSAVLLGNIDVARAGGYSHDDITAMHALANWLLSAPTVIDGELIVMFNRMISGIFGTSVIDGQVISLLMRCCLFTIYPKCESFRSAVRLETFGDDCFCTVRFKYRGFNKLSLTKYCDQLGMVITNADKSTSSGKWDKPTDISFLKRKFVWSESHKAIVGPLDVESICKPLHIGVATTAMSMDELLIEHMTRSLVEMSFHSASEWLKLRDVFVQWNDDLFAKSVVHDWKYDDFIVAWKDRYGAQTHTDDLSNIGSVFGPRIVAVEAAAIRLAHVDPASEVRDLEGYTDQISKTTETLQSGAPELGDSRVDMRVGVLSARSSEQTDLGSFLERPILIHSAAIATGGTVYDTVNFWKDYLTNSTIRDKLVHFRYIRATVVLSVYFNVSPRFYGKFMAAVNWKSPKSGVNDGSFGNYDTGFDDNILASQTMCTYFSTEVDKVELRVPFVYRSEYIDMVNTTLPNGGWVDGEAGLLFVRSMTILRYAGDAPTANCDLQVTMHLEDVELRTTTSSVLANPASESSAVHRINNITNKIVMFGTVAQNVAECVGALASVLGFSRSNIGYEPSLMRLRNIGNTAVSDIPTISAKLSVHKDQGMYVGYDPLNENRNADAESLCHIACRRSYLTKFSWQESDTPTTHLFSIRVKPLLFKEVGIGGFNFTSSAFAAFPFLYWSGTMTLTFDVIASFLHRGRLLFVFDSFDTGSYSLIENRCAILDISTDHSVSLSVTPNGINTFISTGDLETINYATFNISGFDASSYGVISVYVLNRLSGPEAVTPPPVDVLVFSNMEDDARFAVPNANILETMFVEPASECTTKETSIVLNNPFTYADDTLGMYFGESVLSVRALLQRFAFHIVVIPDGATGSRSLAIYLPFRGVWRGPTGANNPGITIFNCAPNTVGGSGYNIAATTPLQYWSSAYVGMRGSVRWKAVALMDVEDGALGYGSWDYSADTIAYFNNQAYTTVLSMDDAGQGMGYALLPGAQLEQLKQQRALEIEVPFYTPLKFVHCRTTRENSALTRPSFNFDGILSVPDHRGVVIMNAVGDDFSLLGYVGPPRIYVDSVWPTRG